jgi:hypothetical protein
VAQGLEGQELYGVMYDKRAAGGTRGPRGISKHGNGDRDAERVREVGSALEGGSVTALGVGLVHAVSGPEGGVLTFEVF